MIRANFSALRKNIVFSSFFPKRKSLITLELNRIELVKVSLCPPTLNTAIRIRRHLRWAFFSFQGEFSKSENFPNRVLASFCFLIIIFCSSQFSQFNFFPFFLLLRLKIFEIRKPARQPLDFFFCQNCDQFSDGVAEFSEQAFEFFLSNDFFFFFIKKPNFFRLFF